jgi:hypothetical protein
MGTIINHLIHPDQYQNYKPKKSLLCPLLAEVAQETVALFYIMLIIPEMALVLKY